MGSLMGLFQIIPLMSCTIITPFFKMSKEMETIKYSTIQLSIFLCLFSVNVMSQIEQPAYIPRHRFSVYAGVGPSYYFNNLQLAWDHVNVVNYSVLARFMWEPEHFLSLGLETGYYRLYTLKTDQPDKVFISNSAIPIQIVVSMKFLQ